MNTIPDIKTILYTTALGKHTRPVFRYAISLAQRYEANIIIIHVVEPLSDTARSVIERYLSKEAAEKAQTNDMKHVLDDIKRRLQAFCNEEMATNKIDVARVQEILVAAGDPSEEILLAADRHHADCIVVGKSADMVYGSTVMGSVARRVSRLAKIPVLVVPNI